MRVRMIKDHKAAFDGHNLQELEKGKTVNAPEGMAKRWIEKGIAMEDKALDKAPETKTATKTTAPKRRSFKKK